MPLIKSSSQTAFNKNVAELINANKSKPAGKKRPMKQVLAIAYAQKRAAK